MALLVIVPLLLEEGRLALQAQNAAPTAEGARLELAKAHLLAPALAAKVDPAIDAVWNAFDQKAAADLVAFMSDYWRLAGNPGYEASLERVRTRLLASQFADGKSAAKASLWFEQSQGQGRGWDHSAGTLSIVTPGGAAQVVLSREKEHLALCINSFSTPAGGIRAPIVDVGAGTPADFQGKDVKGAIVLGDADAGRLWRSAMDKGALGIVSTALAKYVAKNDDILQWSSIPYDEAKKGFGFKATPRAAATLRKALAVGPVQVRVEVASTFSNAPERTLVAEIPGRSLPNERIVIAAHVQEPGASDNASGVATLMEMARSLNQAITSGRIPRPERTITMLWLNEISGSRQWLQAHADHKPGVRYMFSMDMTGEDIEKTGGSFLVERWPDPGAVWERAWDPHSEWGKSDVKVETLKGDLINDLHIAICERVATKSNWIVRSNPYEGGSDHSVFGSSGVPAVLNWHFTDKYYHTNMDTADKTSAVEMRNVATAMIASAWLLASADENAAIAAAELVARSGVAHLSIEARGGGDAKVMNAWKKWYSEAVLSAARLIAVPASPAFQGKLAAIAASVIP